MRTDNHQKPFRHEVVVLKSNFLSLTEVLPNVPENELKYFEHPVYITDRKDFIAVVFKSNQMINRPLIPRQMYILCSISST